jgi:hypothetical protein
MTLKIGSSGNELAQVEEETLELTGRNLPPAPQQPSLHERSAEFIPQLPTNRTAAD